MQSNRLQRRSSRLPFAAAALIVAALAGTSAAAGGDEGSTDPTTTVTVTNPPATNAPVTLPPATNPPVTDPPATNPPATNPPVTNPPVTDAPVTDPPAPTQPALQPPGAPQGVSASSMDGGAHVSWSAPGSGGPAWKYTVQISSGDGKWSKATYVDGSTFSAHVGGLTSGATYQFRVVAWNEGGHGAPSGSVSVQIGEGGTDHSMPGHSMPVGSMPGHSMPGMPMPIDPSLLPGAQPGSSSLNIGAQQYAPYYLDGVGAFRVNCSYSHLNYDDPLVYPGQPGAAHLHLFFGNTDVDAYSDTQSIASSGGSTCTGGTANRSAYWAPAILDAAGNVVVSTDENALQVYYKTGYRGVAPGEVVNFPAGLRMVGGNPAGNSAGDLNSVWYSCANAQPFNRSANIPSCAAGDVMVMTVQFPQCWDGTNLDSADHQSHMAYADPQQGGCPPSHPVALPEVTQNFRYTVPAGGVNGWRLASDMYDGPGGYSGHADWWNGWDATIFQRVIDNCYANALDCRMNNLGDGTRLE